MRKFFQGLIALGGFALLWYLEQAHPLRPNTLQKKKRALTNSGLAIAGATTIAVCNYFIVRRTVRIADRKRFGLLNRIPLPGWARKIAALLLLDYTLYWWHRMNHEAGDLWRFHNVHHTDLDMDSTTSIRFHFGELALSILFRTIQVALIGAQAVDLMVFDNFLLVAIRFHHSNLRLGRWDRRIQWLVVTPEMHGIHHSLVLEETNSNWSTIFSFWDRIHGTLKTGIPPSEITIGVPAYRDPEELTLPELVVMPFHPQRPWALPDGSAPKR